MKRQDWEAQAERDAMLPPKNVLVAPAPPPIGSPTFMNRVDPTTGVSPRDTAHAWSAAYSQAIEEAGRAAVSRSWGRPVTPSEERAVPGVADATRAARGTVPVQVAAANNADRAVPQAVALRRQLESAGISPSESTSGWPFPTWSPPKA